MSIFNVHEGVVADAGFVHGDIWQIYHVYFIRAIIEEERK
jgi:hypothetical protein